MRKTTIEWKGWRCDTITHKHTDTHNVAGEKLVMQCYQTEIWKPDWVSSTVMTLRGHAHHCHRMRSKLKIEHVTRYNMDHNRCEMLSTRRGGGGGCGHHVYTTLPPTVIINIQLSHTPVVNSISGEIIKCKR